MIHLIWSDSQKRNQTDHLAKKAKNIKMRFYKNIGKNKKINKMTFLNRIKYNK